MRKDSSFEAGLSHVARRLLAAGWSANAVTYTALASGLAAGALFYCGYDQLGFAVMLLSGLLDAVDGRVARLGVGPTLWGGVMDLIFDRIVEASILLGLALPQFHRTPTPASQAPVDP